jgi:phage terminase small subunit
MSMRAAGVATVSRPVTGSQQMREIEIQEYARQLLEAHGDKAVVEAAQKACSFETEAIKKRPRRGDTSRRR